MIHNDDEKGFRMGLVMSGGLRRQKRAAAPNPQTIVIFSATIIIVIIIVIIVIIVIITRSNFFELFLQLRFASCGDFRISKLFANPPGSAPPVNKRWRAFKQTG